MARTSWLVNSRGFAMKVLNTAESTRMGEKAAGRPRKVDRRTEVTKSKGRIYK
uniref:Uncharacterized protein n=1 Tax=Picea sitchensis TaxID=3332 RepID=A9NJW8_PICSI|nr:unknown [Picea sitchensis]